MGGSRIERFEVERERVAAIHAIRSRSEMGMDFLYFAPHT